MQAAAGEGSCARARRALSLVLDEEADTFDLQAVAAHVGRCEACRGYLRDVSAITRQLRLERRTIMKRASLIALLSGIVVAAFGAPQAAAQKAPCATSVSRLAPAVRAADLGGGVEFWIQLKCGRRSGLPFG
jgi:predicted anti-sigma-YlaC factor YlaD